MIKVAVIVIDVQEDFLPPNGALAVPDGRDVISPICNILNAGRYPWLAVAITQDWHPETHCLFASNHNVEPYSELEFKHPLGEKNGTTCEVKTQTQTVWPIHCVQDLPGAQVEKQVWEHFERIRKHLPSAVVKKGYLEDREYYLCFCDCWKLHRTEMTEFLQENQITDVVFVGLAYDYCVLHSATDCLESGFNTYVIKDCCRSVFPDRIAQTEKQYSDAGVRLFDDADSLLKHFEECSRRHAG